MTTPTAASTATSSLVARLTEQAKTVSLSDLKLQALAQLKKLSVPAHDYVDRLLRHQEAQQHFVKLKEQQEREEVIHKLLQPYYAELHDCQKKQAELVKRQLSVKFGTPEYEHWTQQMKALQEEIIEKQHKCDEAKNDVARPIESLQRLDEHSDTYQLFARGVHYGYFVLLALIWILYKLYLFLMWTLDWCPATRKDVKRSRAQFEEQISDVKKSLQEATVAMAQQNAIRVAELEAEIRALKEQRQQQETQQRQRVEAMTSLGVQTDAAVQSSSSPTAMSMLSVMDSAKEFAWLMQLMFAVLQLFILLRMSSRG